MRTSHVVVFILTLFMVVLPVYGQTGTSTITGTVTDQQDRVISGASLKLTNNATGAVREAKSNDAGTYNFEFLIPGEYRLEVTAKDFKKQTTNNVRALVGKKTEANVVMEVGAASETVEVTAAASSFLVNTEDATLGNNFVSQQITELPLEAKNIIDLLSLQPGSTREGYVTGARADQSNVTLDGVDINNAQTGNTEVPRDTNNLVIGQIDNSRGDITNGPVLRLNAEAIEEFRVTTANGNANQGRSSGGQINLVTKSGTNAWHGAGFELYRSRGFQANDWFNIRAGQGTPPLQRNTFGGGIGGPILKNKAFFFYSYEGRHDQSGLPQTEIVPLASLGAGTIKYTYCTDASCGTTAIGALPLSDVQQVYSATGINSAALAALSAAAAQYPGNDSSQGDGLNTSGFRFNAPTPTRLNSHIAKFDFNLTKNQTAFFRTNVIYDHQTLPKWLPGAPTPLVWNHPWGFAAGHTWSIGSKIVNNFRYGYTRQAFSETGDSDGNDISFRFVYQPNGQTHQLSRVTPVHNFTDDVSWIHGNHSVQFGANIRMVNNNRISFANAFDSAITNPSFYAGAGEPISADFEAYLQAHNLPGGQAGQSLPTDAETSVQDAATAIIGRFSDFSSSFTFNKDGSLLPSGTPANRDFATQAYDTYVEDSWKVRPNLTFTFGLRYSLEKPVYETHGFEVQPETPLGTFFQNRLDAAAKGENFTDPIVIHLSGPANGGKPMYNWDTNNFQPRVAFAWSPNGGDGFFGRLLGSGNKSVFRGGFALTNDYYGQALAVDWDLNNTLGFTSSANVAANFFNIGGNPGPAFTDFNQDVRSMFLNNPGLAGKVPSGGIQFPLTQPSNEGELIERGVDSNLHAPTEYVWNFTYERQLPKGLVVSASYIGRQANGLLARRDVTAFNDVRDPQSGMDWYTAGTILEKQRQQGVTTDNVASLPFFDHLFPANLVDIVNADPKITDPFNGLCGFTWPTGLTPTQMFYAMQSRSLPSNPDACFAGNDWTDTQAAIDTALFDADLPTRFMHPQYGALSAWTTIAHSNYNAATLSIRERLNSLLLDFNYTFSHSLDNASGLQGSAGYSSAAFIVNPIRPNDFYGNSSFDIRQSININSVWQLPFGKGQKFMSNAGGLAQSVLGGWQLSGIYRWNSGLPTISPYDDSRWATNWNVQANVTPMKPIHTCASRPMSGDAKMFGSCNANNEVYQNFRNAYPGETGPRNYLRLPGYVDLDLGLGKTFTMPWNEGHKLQIRWDAFNVTNTQRFGAVDTSRLGFGVGRDPLRRGSVAPDSWSNFIQIQGQPRVFQIGARYSF